MADIKEKYLDEKFGRLEDKLDNILREAQKTNGRISKVEEKVFCLELHNKETIDCPNTPLVMKHEEELMDVRFFKAYPRIFILGSVIFALAAIFLFLTNVGII